MRRIRKVGHNPIHANAVFIPRIPARHIGPVPLERHGHLPQVLGHVVEGLVELVHGHGIDVGAYAVDVGARG